VKQYRQCIATSVRIEILKSNLATRRTSRENDVDNEEFEALCECFEKTVESRERNEDSGAIGDEEEKAFTSFPSGWEGPTSKSSSYIGYIEKDSSVSRREQSSNTNEVTSSWTVHNSGYENWDTAEVDDKTTPVSSGRKRRRKRMQDTSNDNNDDDEVERVLTEDSTWTSIAVDASTPHFSEYAILGEDDKRSVEDDNFVAPDPVEMLTDEGEVKSHDSSNAASNIHTDIVDGGGTHYIDALTDDVFSNTMRQGVNDTHDDDDASIENEHPYDDDDDDDDEGTREKRHDTAAMNSPVCIDETLALGENCGTKEHSVEVESIKTKCLEDKTDDDRSRATTVAKAFLDCDAQGMAEDVYEIPTQVYESETDNFEDHTGFDVDLRKPHGLLTSRWSPWHSSEADQHRIQ